MSVEAEILRFSKSQSTKSNLYTTVAKTHLGEVAAVVISILISYGRLTAKDISQRSKIQLKLVKLTLVSLIQLNCIYYWHDKTSNNVYYSFNERGILMLLHSGEIIVHIKNKFGEEAAELTQHLIEFGNIKIEDYLINFKDEESKYKRESIITTLFTQKWLIGVSKVDFNPIEDLWMTVYEEVLRNTPRSTTMSEAKRIAEVKEEAKQKLSKLIENSRDVKQHIVIKDGLKRMNPSTIIRFNLDRFEKHLRTRCFVDFSRFKIGVLSSMVYEAALTAIEDNSPDMRHFFLEVTGLLNDPDERREFTNSIENKLVDDKKITFTLKDVLKYLPKEVDLRNSILSHNFLKPNPISKKRVNSDSEDQAPKKIKLEPDSEGQIQSPEEHTMEFEDFQRNIDVDNSNAQSLGLINQHLKLLASNSSVKFVVETTPGVYMVPFTEIVKNLKRHYYDTLVKYTLGADSLRVLRCLKACKIADEKTLANSVLLKEKAVRNTLFNLINLNIIEIQEVPRSADRAASKTFFLFRHKESNAYSFLRNSLLFSMAELSQNIIDFKSENKILLEKCEREDVKGHEDELLLESELKLLKNLKAREILNIGKINRLKSMFEVFGVL
ncbi:Piso0_004227 [Millerozyma farinosa CBS 7064]|uniref:DNA-directed RNA polymerase III subunit RPC3 n=1 Tax=Pichia sorbitophila (strain ATCC MYA-4447 / BCRC 22081 / CBS 7064 / NBRC 10061 / NRRL Y-12695) TaxID=559304 RepID=G8Y7U4_PICSO|nr:Piso0_004227 [Millerozyma farinosa CBS 7064]CCE84674.1 Piso0_004227 [Millerozyma farinosa CBS 7064]